MKEIEKASDIDLRRGQPNESLPEILVVPRVNVYLTYYLLLIRALFGEGNGTPLQHSCLENPMDGGAW